MARREALVVVDAALSQFVFVVLAGSVVVDVFGSFDRLRAGRLTAGQAGDNGLSDRANVKWRGLKRDDEGV